MNVSHGFRDSTYYHDDLYKVVAQRYENVEQETEQIQRALTVLQTQRAQRQINNVIRQTQIQQNIITH